MLDWISEATVIRIITVLFVLSTVLIRSKKAKLQWIISISAVAAAVPLIYRAGGYHAVISIATGAVTALIFVLLMRRLKLMTRRDATATCALGILMGPIGFAIACGIAVGFVLIQRCIKGRMTTRTNFLLQQSPFYPPVRSRNAVLPTLVEVESHRMLEDDRAEGITFGNAGYTGRNDACMPVTHLREEVLPWTGKIAIAALAVLMLGISG